jgi:TonB family protein
VSAPAAIRKSFTIPPALRESIRAMDRRTLITRGALTLGVLIFAILLWRGISEPSIDRSHNVLALNAEPTQSGQLRLTWDRNSTLVARNAKATLWITDGTEEKQIVLDSEQLKTGVIVYNPVSGDVNFRLQVGDFAESLRAISPRFTTKPDAAVNAEPAPLQTAPPQTAPPQTRARTEEIPPPQAQTIPETVASVPEPAPPKPAANKGFVPARAVRQFTPTPPRGMKLAEDVSVSVKVTLDESGHVKSTDLVSQNVDSRLANAAMDAARRWRFEPARQNQRRVSTSVVLHFKFNREPTGGG